MTILSPRARVLLVTIVINFAHLLLYEVGKAKDPLSCARIAGEVLCMVGIVFFKRWAKFGMAFFGGVVIVGMVYLIFAKLYWNLPLSPEEAEKSRQFWMIYSIWTINYIAMIYSLFSNEGKALFLPKNHVSTS